MNFIALDLEATGLSPTTDTIIEIAAIRFNIEFEGDCFVIKNVEEHSQLIYPERELDQEISMITGISNQMLVGKPTFDEVKEKVRLFIGDSIIVGHNVLFDTAMLETHGINLSKHIVIDTFELSEIFSQDVESLNLGFLANHYHLINPDEEEHRALTDTKISVRLLLHYLGRIRNLNDRERNIWNILKQKDTSHILKTLSNICHIETSEQDSSGIFIDLLGKEVKSESNNFGTSEKKKSVKKLLDTHGNINEELRIITDAFKTHSHIELITSGYKTAEWMSRFLTEHQIENIISIKTEKWCSVEYIRELLMSDLQFGRKKFILIAKLSFWIGQTKTGLLDELKYYGDERNMLPLFFCRENEWNIWREEYAKKIRKTPLLISEIGNQSASDRYTIIKDIPLIEDVVRRKESVEIDFDTLMASMNLIHSGNISEESIIHMNDMIGIIRSIYESIPERPTGPLAYPPGNHGETYFITQAMLWHRGHKWLVHSNRTLELSWKNYKDTHTKIEGRENILALEYIEKCLNEISLYHNRVDHNRNIILSIQNEKTKITLIPRKIEKYIHSLLNSSVAYGSNIGLPQTKAFLMREYDYMEDDFIVNGTIFCEQNIKNVEYHPSIVIAGTVILTTSQKHARDLGQVLRKIHGKNIDILIQGLSGGKGKMLSTFKKNIHKTILIGIIDTWRDEYSLWPNAESIIITKIPFDPPTDPYFLARTVGMQNNFSEYSEPIVTIRLNTLFERISSSGYNKPIFITDTRLSDTEWGKRIQKELL